MTMETDQDDRMEMSEEEKLFQERLEKLLQILNGQITIDLHMQFLIKNNHADLLILKQIKVNEK
jgi:26S proteasome regulatory subunit N2